MPSSVRISLHILGFAPRRIRSASCAPLTFSRHRILTRDLLKVWRRALADSSRFTQAMNLFGMRWGMLARGLGVEVPLDEARMGSLGWIILSRIPETMATPIVPLRLDQKLFDVPSQDAKSIIFVGHCCFPIVTRPSRRRTFRENRDPNPGFEYVYPMRPRLHFATSDDIIMSQSVGRVYLSHDSLT
jgi:hypothetical protein